MNLYRALHHSGRILGVFVARDESHVWAYCQGSKMPVHRVEHLDPAAFAGFGPIGFDVR